MDAATAVDLTRDALMTAMVMGAPLLVVGIAVGLVMGVIQALTQLHDPTIAFVPKLLAMVAALAFCLPWLIQRMIEYAETLIRNIPQTIAGG